MAVFPDLTLNPDEGMSASQSHGVEWSQSVSGKDWAVDLWAGQQKRAWKPQWGYVTVADEQTLREFYEANADNSFYLFDWDQRRIYSAQAADEAGTGALATFTIPGKTTTSQAVYVDAVSVSAASWSISAGTGTNGEDQVVFSTATPGDGTTVTVDFTGRKRYEARFDGDLDDSYNLYPGVSCTLVEVF